MSATTMVVMLIWVGAHNGPAAIPCFRTMDSCVNAMSEARERFAELASVSSRAVKAACMEVGL